ncbi:MAG: hypothetical protein BMS9Abin08_0545 [Gammaproteobacteria bacterium]|nr:MAG: hypothetical protein BMS9Abin08_0545 [Gammaproteobacteria bacterium]
MSVFSVKPSIIKSLPVHKCLLFVICLSLSIDATANGPGKMAWVEGQIIVKPRAGLSDAQFEKILNNAHCRSKHRLKHVNVHIVEVAPQAEDAVIRALSNNPYVEYAEKDMLVKLSALPPDDPKFSSQWHLPLIQAPVAWDTSTGEGITVAILDTGVEGSHPDLVNNLVPGWNVVSNNSDTSPVMWHGTSVAGTVAATSNNATGVASVAWNARIMPIRITDRADGVASWSAMANGIIWAADHGADVANLSYSLSTDSITINNAAQYMRSKGGLTVVAAGNDKIDRGFSDNPYLITVSATTSSDTRAGYSNYGNNIDIAAPGSSITTTYTGGGYKSVSGTSFASPATAGVIALIMAANPGLSPDEVEGILESSAIDLGDAGWDPLFGYGRVNAAAAVQLASGGAAFDSLPPTVAITAPANGAMVSGTVVVDINATDNVGVMSVELYANGELVGADSTRPYAFSWDSASANAGDQVTLTAIATDAAGNTGSTVVTVTIEDTRPPVVTAPSAITVEATAMLTSVNLGTANAIDNVDGAVAVTANPAGPFAVGQYTVIWSATDSAGNTASANQQLVVTDTTPPVITTPVDIIIQAPGALTSVNLGQAAAQDLVDGSMPATPGTSGPFPVGTTVVTWRATDRAGNTASATQRVTVTVMDDVTPPVITVTDTTPPVISLPANVSVDASGYLTEVDQRNVTASDAVSGTITPLADPTGPYTSGIHAITWTATDAAGNEARAIQTLSIRPLINLATDQTVVEGNSVTVEVFLSGPAPVYPVLVPYIVRGSAVNPENHDAVDGVITINSGTSARLVFNTVDDGISGELADSVVFELQAQTQAVAGARRKHTVTIIEGNAPPLVRLQAEQSGAPTLTVFPDGGAVMVSAEVRDPNTGDSHSFDWSLTDNRLVDSGAAGEGGFSFDPQLLAEGVYVLHVSVTDNGIPAQTVSNELLIRVSTVAPDPAAGSDRDGDGIPDTDEGRGDGDQDGIPDYLDAIDEPAILQSVELVAGRALLSTEPGLGLRLGGTALATGRFAAGITLRDIEAYAAQVSGVSTPVDDSLIYPGGLFDFEITGLSEAGQSVRVVIPQVTPVGAGAVYRKYLLERGWLDFIEDSLNSVSSAPGSPESCPAPGAEAYQPGLQAGHYCVQLTLEDGGPNDADGQRNGVIRDPGGVGVLPQSAADTSEGGSSEEGAGGGGGCVVGARRGVDPLLPALLLLSAMGLMYRVRGVTSYQVERLQLSDRLCRIL